MNTLGRLAFGALAIAATLAFGGLASTPAAAEAVNGKTAPVKSAKAAGDTDFSAQRWRYRDNGHEIGVIASVTQAFCRDCSRARLATDGKLYTCLFADAGYDLRALLRETYSDTQIAKAIAAIWRRRADRYSEIRTANTPKPSRIEMSYIGG